VKRYAHFSSFPGTGKRGEYPILKPCPSRKTPPKSADSITRRVPPSALGRSPSFSVILQSQPSFHALLPPCRSADYSGSGIHSVQRLSIVNCEPWNEGFASVLKSIP
jgi:hypothetical protein